MQENGKQGRCMGRATHLHAEGRLGGTQDGRLGTLNNWRLWSTNKRGTYSALFDGSRL